MQLVSGSERIIAHANCNPVQGTIRWAPMKSLWIGSMTMAALVLGPLYFSWTALLLFIVSSGITLCAGHSVGMHRRLIHNSFDCPLWLEYVCVYLGVLVGMAGPIGMIRLHDMRDWAQRQRACHGYFAHDAGFWRDGWHQLHCCLDLRSPPEFKLEPRLANDRVYRWLEQTWMAQQFPWAFLFLALGGVPWLIWGVCARVAVCVTGHWLVGHYAHREGGQTWLVSGACVQGYDVKIAGLISMGACSQSQECAVRRLRRRRRQLGGNRDADRELQTQRHQPARVANRNAHEARERSSNRVSELMPWTAVV